MRTETFFLPIHWAVYFLYGDDSAYSDDDLAEMSEWEAMHDPGLCINVEASADSLGSDDLSFSGDDGTCLCVRCTFTFQAAPLPSPIYSDGEVIAWE